VEAEAVPMGLMAIMDYLEVLAVVELEVRGRQMLHLELQILEVVVVEVLTLVEPHPTRHSVERVVQVLL
jgi:hypothetical protein